MTLRDGGDLHTRACPSSLLERSKPEHVRLQELCARTLYRAGNDPYRWEDQQMRPGVTRYGPLQVTIKNSGSPREYSFLATNKLLILPAHERSYFSGRRRCLAFLSQRARTIHWGTVTFGKPCGLEEAVARTREGLKEVTKFFEKVRESYDVELLFARVEDSMRKKDRSLRLRPGGDLLHHIHVHFVLRFNVPREQRARWNVRFRKAFGAGSRIERVREIEKVISYITKPTDFAALLVTREYIAWARLMKGVRRSEFLGGFARRLRAHKRQDLEIVLDRKTFDKVYYKIAVRTPTRPRAPKPSVKHSPAVVRPNSVISKRIVNVGDDETILRTLILNRQ